MIISQFIYSIQIYLRKRKHKHTFANKYAVMSTVDINIEASAEINRWTEKAFSTYLFFSKLPSPLSSIVFKRIIDDSYCIASSLPKATRLDSVIEGISNAIDLDCDDFSPLLDYLQIRVVEKNDIDSTISKNDRGRIKKALNSKVTLRGLPAKENLVDSFPCFSQTVLDNDVIPNYKEIVRNRLTAFSLKYGNQFFESPMPLKIRPFQTLGYKTLFNEWFNDETDRQIDLLLFRWYCKGDLLCIVLDTIFRGESTSISRVMWKYLNDACEKDPYLREITQEQYEEYRIFVPSVPPHEFVFKGKKPLETDAESLGLFPTLPRVVRKQRINGYLNENEIFALYEKLIENGFLDRNETPFEAFSKVFSGEGRCARPIKWHGQQKELATFLAIAQGRSTSKEYSKAASSLFLQKNGKSCQINTLNQPDYSIDIFDNIMDEILNI